MKQWYIAIGRAKSGSDSLWYSVPEQPPLLAVTDGTYPADLENAVFYILDIDRAVTHGIELSKTDEKGPYVFLFPRHHNCPVGMTALMLALVHDWLTKHELISAPLKLRFDLLTHPAEEEQIPKKPSPFSAPPTSPFSPFNCWMQRNRITVNKQADDDHWSAVTHNEKGEALEVGYGHTVDLAIQDLCDSVGLLSFKDQTKLIDLLIRTEDFKDWQTFIPK